MGFVLVSTEIQDESLKKLSFSLEQNYPSPLNPSTTISWQSPVICWQTLKIYDILGNEIAILVDEYKPAGSNEVLFDFSSTNAPLPISVFSYRLRVNNFVSAQKMILMKEIYA